jgi:hypothetical protein
MERVKRSEGRRRFVDCRIPSLSVVGGLSLAGLSLAAFLAGLTLGGCGGLDLLAPNMEDIVEANRLHFEETDLAPSVLEGRMKEIDEAYAEPRTSAKVAYSYETCVTSISRVNNYAALWRGARACAWLAENSPDRSKRDEYAMKGIAMGKEAVKRISAIRQASSRPEPDYYFALCIASWADLHRPPSSETLRRMKDHMSMALAFDEKYDYAGPHRFMGQLMVKTDPYPTYAVGSLKEGLEHLKKATLLYPDYGENHLAYAEALKGDGQNDLARAELERVIASVKPQDRSTEHDAWLTRANEMLQDLQGK